MHATHSRRLAAILAVALVALTGCQPARSGRRCATTDFGRDTTHVLQCRNGRWVRIMTRSDATRAVVTLAAARAHDPVATVDRLDTSPFTVRVQGWVRDPDGRGAELHTWVDGRWGSAGARVARPDVPGAAIGVDARITVPAGRHEVCVHAINAPGTRGGNVVHSCVVVLVPSDAPPDPLSPKAGWLETTNYHRQSSGLEGVVNEPEWSDGILKHLAYLANTATPLRSGQYASGHTENPASPWYTPEGDLAAKSSNLGGGRDERDAVEGWLDGPFHALGVLRPGLTRAAFSMYGFEAGIDVIRGAGSTTISEPVLFPGRNAVVRLRSYDGGENPDPLESCPGYAAPTGVPILVQLPAGAPTAGLTARVHPPNEPSANLEICVVTKETYRTSDPVYGPTGGQLLTGANALYIVPRAPLTGGYHSVEVDVPGQGTIAWRFAVTD